MYLFVGGIGSVGVSVLSIVRVVGFLVIGLVGVGVSIAVALAIASVSSVDVACFPVKSENPAFLRLVKDKHLRFPRQIGNNLSERYHVSHLGYQVTVHEY